MLEGPKSHGIDRSSPDRAAQRVVALLKDMADRLRAGGDPRWLAAALTTTVAQETGDRASLDKARIAAAAAAALRARRRA